MNRWILADSTSFGLVVESKTEKKGRQGTVVEGHLRALQKGAAQLSGVRSQEHPTGKAREDLRSNWRSADLAVAEESGGKGLRQNKVPAKVPA
jgi:hypothetical protein